MNMRSNHAIRSRLAAWLGFSHSNARDLYAAFGYPRVVVTEQLEAMYMRNDIANRIISAFSSATWKDQPVIRDEAGDSAEPDGDSYSPFVEAVEDYFDERKIFSVIERADRLSTIGRFGLLLVGTRDGQRLDTPWTKKKSQLLYLQPYLDSKVTISSWITDEKDARFGKPEFYTLQQGSLDTGVTTVSKSVRVHWTRVIHIAERLEQDEIFGTPRLLPVFNRLMDLEKVLGSSAETFWLNARPGLALSADADATFDEGALADMKTQADEFEHQLRRTLTMQGITPTQLSATIADPKPNVESLVKIIAGAVGMPERILSGSERGELSSSQDENNWSERIGERRIHFATPKILQPIIQRLIDMGELPEPEGKWWVEWPENDVLGPEKLSTIAMNKSTTLKNYVTSPGADQIVPPEEFRTDFLGLAPESEYDPPEPDPIDETDPEAQDQFAKTKAAAKPDTKANRGKMNAKPRTLYVYRPVLNAKDIVDWAKSQGFDTTLPASDMHVTIAYSRSKVDWMKIEPPYLWGNDEDRKAGIVRIAPGGPRLVDALGKQGECAALMIRAVDLEWRHKELLDKGCSYDFTTYSPHITISYKVPEGMDLSKIEAYTGEIVLGPECFEEIAEDWSDSLVENKKLKEVAGKFNKLTPAPKKAKTNAGSKRSVQGQQRRLGNAKGKPKTRRKR